MVTPIAIVGVGKIARDRHIPSIAASEAFRLAATVSTHGGLDGVPDYASLDALAAAQPEIRAVSLCTPPSGRVVLVADALRLGLDVLMEKPPAATLAEAEAIADLAAGTDRVVFASWHSRHAAAVAPARDWLTGKAIERVAIRWKEDVRVWHPGQDWIWRPGVGVFDPGVNALSILDRLLPDLPRLEAAELSLPANRAAPIAARLTLKAGHTPIVAEFDFDQRGGQVWEIEVATDAGRLLLFGGGAKMALDGVPLPTPPNDEYRGVYARFAELLAARESDVDCGPLRLVADALRLGRRRTVGDFHWG